MFYTKNETIEVNVAELLITENANKESLSMLNRSSWKVLRDFFWDNQSKYDQGKHLAVFHRLLFHFL